jgi:hypothetical protein
MEKPTRTVLLTYGKSTLFVKSEFGFGFNKVEVKSVRIEVGTFAQYNKAYHVYFVPKGARKERHVVIYGYSDIVGYLFAGHGMPNLNDWMKPDEHGNRVSRHYGFSPEWDKEMKEYASNFYASCLFDASKNP